jgi:hypothetical protein
MKNRWTWGREHHHTQARVVRLGAIRPIKDSSRKQRLQHLLAVRLVVVPKGSPEEEKKSKQQFKKHPSQIQ